MRSQVWAERQDCFLGVLLGIYAKEKNFCWGGSNTCTVVFKMEVKQRVAGTAGCPPVFISPLFFN